MKRRSAMKIAAGAIIGGGAGVLTLTQAFKPEPLPEKKPQKLEPGKSENNWKYAYLDPAISGQIAYDQYSVGSCMYASFYGVASQIAEKFGGEYASFPFDMMKYGHGGVGGFGTLCGALNGAAALIGLFVGDKKMRDSLINDLFQWYENTQLPVFKPRKAVMDYTPASSVSHSTLCHASTINWGKASGFKIDSDERKERCRRLSGEVAAKVTTSLNSFFNDDYVTVYQNNDNAGTCLTCHGKEGKLNNISGKMDCNSCHTKSVAHKLFGDVHYKYMKAK
ncbi:hypothetical protein GM418_26230 [Maribellus comscasis]|uniref:Uncharacterized protein n=1 Tax=Maribellus comscasis TaxID=2681766 RepID=A0A6I6K5X1_9BACT|nr:C-GCAxxG-C-C family protein [Maribellus comscasis]QGY47033.1 hypothetical protein GM418_26230 [Maribellus comscasis]